MSVLRNIKHSFEIPFKKIKDFLFSKWSKEFLIFLLFFVMASIFWVIRALNDDYEIKLSIPIRLYNVPKNIIITRDLPSSLTVRIKDKGTALVEYLLGKNLNPVFVNFNDYSADGNMRVQILSSDLEKAFLNQFSQSTRILSITPNQIEYIYCKGTRRRIPIKITGNVKPSRQYYISDTIIQPAYVIAYAPRNILDTLRYAYTEPVNIDSISDKSTYSRSIRPIRGVKFTPSTVRLSFHTDIYSEKTLDIPIIGTGFPKDKRLLTFPSKVSVSFQVGSTLFKQISASDFSIEISYESLMHYNGDKYPIHLTKSPEEIHNIRISPLQVDFLIEQNKQHER